ncbi:MAG: hypothetical protein ACMG6E_03295, partial [Candidatus Roizmanbacteria bacterium]
KDAKKKKVEKSTTKGHKRGKAYLKAKSTLDSSKSYTLTESIEKLKKGAYVKFDETFELHLNVKETGIKGEVILPHATGKTVRVVVVDDDLLEKLEEGTIDFDVLITHPSFMPKLAKFAKTLGPKGLMPNPKSGTVTIDTDAALKKFSGGTIRFKTEPKAPLIHFGIGKMSMKDAELEENIKGFVKAVGTDKIEAVYLCTTMTPSMRIDMASL